MTVPDETSSDTQLLAPIFILLFLVRQLFNSLLRLLLLGLSGSAERLLVDGEGMLLVFRQGADGPAARPSRPSL